ncbi:Uncharacterized protein GY17_00002351 [Cryptosporidium hominis]|uniref:Uncharacterized protein n=1 Tax=Cryptosporidium hominis TaxID=237895 RepID=A0ABX5BED7_CRYHO|nr:hypothetical protein [Cryptosporidium hominis TU502]PPS95698.1 Uncharacterized protein GY17_00002351 [Cryptosporidium hominis]|eukprot:PPS95698.1 Uncharacterized protein GY17_00002351 [Cryptosporidium hominis]
MTKSSEMSGSVGSKNIERMINSSLDDIVREAKKERQKKANLTQSRVRNGRGGKGRDLKKRSERRPNSVNSNGRRNFKGSPGKISRSRGGNRGRGFDQGKRMSKDQVKSIQIVAKLDSIPTPTAQQKAGLNNLEIIPSSISSQKARRNRVFS